MARGTMTEAQARAWQKREARKSAREKARRLRAELREGRKALRAKLPELRAECRARKERVREERRAALVSLRERHRDELRELRELMRAKLQAIPGACRSERRTLRAEVDALRQRAAFAAREYQWKVAEHRRELPPRGMTTAERREHERDEVLAHLSDDEALRDLFLDLWRRRAIRSTPRATLTEVFLDYVHRHPEELSERRHAQERAYLAQLEAEERAAWEASRPSKRGRRAVLPAADAGDWF